MLRFKQSTRINDVRMFLELCAGMASTQSLVGTNWRRTIWAHDSVGVYHVPIMREEPMFAAIKLLRPVTEPMFRTESIYLEKLAWQWQTTPHGVRLHTIYIGKGYETWTLVWSRPEIRLI